MGSTNTPAPCVLRSLPIRRRNARLPQLRSFFPHARLASGNASRPVLRNRCVAARAADGNDLNLRPQAEPRERVPWLPRRNCGTVRSQIRQTSLLFPTGSRSRVLRLPQACARRRWIEFRTMISKGPETPRNAKLNSAFRWYHSSVRFRSAPVHSGCLPSRSGAAA